MPHWPIQLILNIAISIALHVAIQYLCNELFNVFKEGRQGFENVLRPSRSTTHIHYAKLQYFVLCMCNDNYTTSSHMQASGPSACTVKHLILNVASGLPQCSYDTIIIIAQLDNVHKFLVYRIAIYKVCLFCTSISTDMSHSL